jgi:hypothetical protein
VLAARGLGRAPGPGNAVGWMFSAIVVLAFIGQLAGQYATDAPGDRPGSLPEAILAAWYGSWPRDVVLALALVFTPPLLFPSGRLAGGRPSGWPERRRRRCGAGRPLCQAGQRRGPGDREPDRGRGHGEPEESVVGTAL